MQIVYTIVFWLGLWAVGWSGFYQLKSWGVDYIKRFQLMIWYFVVVMSLIVWYFWSDFLPYLSVEFQLLPFAFLAAMFLVNYLLYDFIKLFYQEPTQYFSTHPNSNFLKLNKSYLLTKAFELAFQQLLILLLIIWLKNDGLDLWQIVAVFSVIFGLGHLYLLKMNGRFFGTIFTISSMFSAIFFPTLILLVDWGFVYSYICHSFFYMIIVFAFWYMKDRKLHLKLDTGRI